MTLLDQFEQTHAGTFARFATFLLPSSSWRTPDGRNWVPQDVLRAWGSARVSDRWAFVMLHTWIVQKRVTVEHAELPAPLRWHDETDPAWAAIVREYGPGVTEPFATFGRADLACEGKDGTEPLLMVEFGTCAPAKFVLNLGLSTPSTHWMIVSYGAPYAFVFRTCNGPLFEPQRVVQGLVDLDTVKFSKPPKRKKTK